MHNAEVDSQQSIYYLPGNGTQGESFRQNFKTGWKGEILPDVVMAYFWLVRNFQTGDTISLIGYSRSAFTMCLLAHVIDDIGFPDALKVEHVDPKTGPYFLKQTFQEYERLEQHERAGSGSNIAPKTPALDHFRQERQASRQYRYPEIRVSSFQQSLMEGKESSSAGSAEVTPMSELASLDHAGVRCTFQLGEVETTARNRVELWGGGPNYRKNHYDFPDDSHPALSLSLLVSLASLLLRTLAKPMANSLKTRAKDHETFRNATIQIAQFMHRAEMHMRTKLLGEAVTAKHIRPLNDNKAIDAGANFISESFLFVFAASLIMGETWRSSRKEQGRRDLVKETLENHGNEIQELRKKLEQEQAERERGTQRERELEGIVEEIVGIGIRGGWVVPPSASAEWQAHAKMAKEARDTGKLPRRIGEDEGESDRPASVVLKELGIHVGPSTSTREGEGKRNDTSSL
ncbi:optic atrophy 3-like family protein [Pseudohyphozyma bogoriensis]|nr:optic atrophy 3-like family protein [Pseudohyphozyma bogoriensis]